MNVIMCLEDGVSVAEPPVMSECNVYHSPVLCGNEENKMYILCKYKWRA